MHPRLLPPPSLDCGPAHPSVSSFLESQHSHLHLTSSAACMTNVSYCVRSLGICFFCQKLLIEFTPMLQEATVHSCHGFPLSWALGPFQALLKWGRGAAMGDSIWTVFGHDSPFASLKPRGEQWGHRRWTQPYPGCRCFPRCSPQTDTPPQQQDLEAYQHGDSSLLSRQLSAVSFRIKLFPC